MSNEFTLKLSKPIKAHDEEVSELIFREPTTKEIIEIGLPTLLIAGDDPNSTGVEIRQKVIAKYVSRLTLIPMSSVEALSISDFSRATSCVMGFFGMGDGEAPKN